MLRGIKRKVKNKTMYEEGVLKPIGKLDLKEGEEVEIELKKSIKERTFGVIPLSDLEVEECYKAIKDYALLTNDAFHVATMKRHEILNIATNDPDFERVKWIKVWKP